MSRKSQGAESPLEEVRAADARARELAQTSFEQPLVLEAGAGTGKTATLVARVIAWAFGPGWELARTRVREREAERPAASNSRSASAAGESEPGEQEAAASDDEAALREAVAAEVLSRIVAITFTEAAAAEMAERVAAALQQLAGGELPAGLLQAVLPSDPLESRVRALALLSQLDRFVVRTIHGFCRRLLAQWPLEAGLSPVFTVDADGSILRACAREAVETAIADAYPQPERPLSLLASAGHGPPDIEDLLVAALSEGVTAEIFDADPFSRDRMAAFAESMHDAAANFFRAGGDALRSVTTARTASTIEAADTLSTLPAPAGGDDLAALGAWFEKARAPWDDPGRVRVREWVRGKFGKKERETLGESADEFSTAAGLLLPWIDSVRAIDPVHTSIVREALRPLLRAVEQAMEQRGAVGYAGLLERTQRLLCENPSVAERARSAIDQLLIDEFQDTDATQCEIVRALAGIDDSAAKRPGLFLVGDPKQSIYGWRGADLAAYESFVGQLEAADGERHALRVNFRSVPAILDEVERVMEGCMHYEAGLQPAFEALVPSPAREREPGFESSDEFDWAPVEHWVSWEWTGGEGSAGETRDGAPKPTPSLVASRIEAESVADDLRALRERHSIAWSSVGILLRATTQLDVLLAALQSRGIPYAVAAEKSFYQKREVADASLALRCVLDAHDRVAFVGWLRSAVVGVPDAALFPLSESGVFTKVELLGDSPENDTRLLGELAADLERARAATPGDVPGAVRGECAPGWTVGALAAFESLAVLRRSSREDAPDRFLRRFRRLLPIEALEAARYLGRHRAVNLDRFFRELRDRLVDERDPAAVTRWLRTRRDEAGERPSEGAPATSDAVQVMTIHAAKGLDFDHLYLLQTHRDRGRSGTEGLSVAVSRDGFVEFAGLGACSPGHAAIAEQKAALEEAEHVRTLYVALTRARDRLVVAGAWPARSSASPTHAELVARRGNDPDELRAEMDQLAERRGLAVVTSSASEESAAAQTERPKDASAGRPVVALGGAHFLFPGLWSASGSSRDEAAVGKSDRSTSESGVSPAEVRALPNAAEQAALRDTRRSRRSHARTRMRRAIGGRASSLGLGAGARSPDEAGDLSLVREDQAARFANAGEPESGGRAAGDASANADLARRSGTLVHQLLELLDLTAAPLGPRLRAGLDRILPAEEAGEPASGSEGKDSGGRALRERGIELIEALEQGPLLERLAELAEQVVARELPVLLPAPPAGGDSLVAAQRGLEASPPDAPLGFVSGAIDLVFRDPETADWVVVDYKTDRVADAAEARARAEEYRGQAEAYGHALREGLGLDSAPRLELWFLRSGEVVALAPRD